MEEEDDNSCKRDDIRDSDFPLGYGTLTEVLVLIYRLVGYLSVSIGVTCVWVKPRLMELILKETRWRWERSPNLASVLGVLVWHHFGLV